MRSTIIPLFLVTALTAGAALAAGSTANGTIKAIDTTAMSITLQDGTVYMLPAGFKIADLKVGEKVAVTWDMKGTVHEASAVTAAN